jgi:hypothetical protein
MVSRGRERKGNGSKKKGRGEGDLTKGFPIANTLCPRVGLFYYTSTALNVLFLFFFLAHTYVTTKARQGKRVKRGKCRLTEGVPDGKDPLSHEEAVAQADVHWPQGL